MMPFVRQVAGVPDLPHIGFFLRKMLDSVSFKIFNSFHTGEFIFMPFDIKLQHLLHNGKELAVRLIYDFHADIKPILPLDLLHIVSFFAAAYRVFLAE